MKYYSTNHKAPMATLREAVEHGLAPDRGLYMPETIKRLPESFFENIDKLSFQEIALEVARCFFGDTDCLRHLGLRYSSASGQRRHLQP